MIIENVKIENFLSHRNSDINLGTGINIIIGQNGSGKSSIFEAIKVAFFGQAESYRRRLVSYNSTLAKIHVKFRIGDHEYEAVRQIENRKDKETTKLALLLMDGQKIVEGASAVTAELQKIIGISKSAFINSIYVDQGQIDSLVKESPAERKDVFNEIIGLRNYDRAFAEVDRIVKNMAGKIDEQEPKTDELAKMMQEVGSKETELKNLAEKNEINKKELEESEELLENLNKKYIEYSGIISVIRSNKEKISELEKDKAYLDEKIRKINEGMEKLEFLKAELQNIENNDLYLHGDKIALIEQNYRQIDDEKKQIEQLKLEVEKLNKSVEREKDERQKYNIWKQKLEEIEKNEKELSSLTENHVKYITLGKEIKDKQSEIVKLRAELNECEVKIPERIISEKLPPEDVDKEIAALRNEENEINSKSGVARNEILNFKNEIDKANNKILNLKDEKECPLCGQELTAGHLHRVMDEYRKQVSDMEEGVKSNNNLIAALDRKKENLKSRIDLFSSQHVKNYYAILDETGRLTREIQAKELELEGLDKSHARFEELKKVLEGSDALKRDFRAMENEYLKLQKTIEVLGDQNIGEKIERENKKIENLHDLNKSNEKSFKLWSEGKRSDEYQELKDKAARIKKDIDSYSNAVQDLNDTKSRRSATEETINKNMQENEKRSVQLASFGEIEKQLSGANERKRTLAGLELNLAGQISSLKASIEEMQKNAARLGNELDEIKNLRKIYEFLSMVRKAFNRDGIPQLIRQMALESINSITRNLISRFNLNMEDIRISEDLDVEIMQNGSVKNITQLSGGEKTAVSIAMRLAIAKYLGRNISTIMMDEPTVYLDEERRNDLREILQYAMKDLSDEGIFPQIVIITHHPELETAADISLHVRKFEGASVVETSSY
ncbi:MAG: AAA family ATPase [Candidatus Thermoplasmatota archaeon]|nr:AAA family ATPase [Candidatus Thermoplasmatota archaeon]